MKKLLPFLLCLLVCTGCRTVCYVEHSEKESGSETTAGKAPVRSWCNYDTEPVLRLGDYPYVLSWSMNSANSLPFQRTPLLSQYGNQVVLKHTAS